MRLNKNQRDGLAKICDNLTTAFIITAVLGSWIEDRVSIFQAAAVLMCAIGFATLGVYFRKEIGDGE
jgi:hypothetical protein